MSATTLSTTQVYRAYIKARAEGFSRITHEIKDIPGGVCSLTVTHELENTPTLARLVSGAQEEYGAGGGDAWVLSDIKSLLETGKSFAN